MASLIAAYVDPGDTSNGLAATMHDSASPEDSEGEVEEGPLSLDTDVHDDNAMGEDVVGFSISAAQDYLKSPKTPAVEKAKVLDGSHDYFATAEVSEKRFDGSYSLPTHSVDARKQSSPHFSRDEALSPWKADDAHRKRSSTARTLLGHHLSLPRQRSSSGPSSLGESLKKLLPDMSSFFPKNVPAVAGFGFGAYVREPDSLDGALSTNRMDTRSTESLKDIPNQQRSMPEINTVVQEQTSTSAMPQDRPSASRNVTATLLSPTESILSGKLRRSTSESSLYLRRTKTSSSAAHYDDISVFADVSSQVNSRFKAIQDTWQDSAFSKMPKLPSVSMRKGLPFEWMTTLTTDLHSTETSREVDQNTKPDQIASHGSADGTNANNRAHPIIHRALSKMTGDVLVMGGYRGSILRSAEPPHRQLWVPVKVGLNIRKVDLEVGLNDEDEERMPEKIFASGILAHIGPVDISRRLLRHLRKCPNARSEELRVHDYGYDWRLSPELLSGHLINYLENLECNKPNVPRQSRGAWVIAHSLGGLIARHAVNLRPELFAGVVFAGTPQTCVNILGPLRNGDDVLLSSRVLTAQTNFSFRTSFALLPEDGRCFISKTTGERYDVDFFKPETYDEYRLTPCINPPLPPLHKHPRKSIVGAMSTAWSETISSNLPNRRPQWFRSSSPDLSGKAEDAKDAVKDTGKDIAHTGDHTGSLEPSNMSSNQPGKSIFSSPSHHSVATACTIPKDVAFEYLGRTLASVLRFKQALHFKPEHQEANAYPPFGFMFGKTVPTVYGARVESREAIKRSDAYDDLAFAAGDGVVLASAAQLPAGYRCVRGGRIETDRGHVGLLGDLEGVGRALEAVVDARGKGVGLGADSMRRKHQHSA
jgi:pimeloyl-ACP methyl ester carboxylesterase